MVESSAREHRTVRRVTTILEAVAAHPGGLRLNDLVIRMAAPKSSVFGLAKGLVADGYLIEVGGYYRIGPALKSLIPEDRPSIEDAAGPSMRSLSATFNETAMLATPAGNSMVYISTVESSHLIRYNAPLRVRRPLYPPSAGKVILAHRSARAQEAYLRSLGMARQAVNAAMIELEEVADTGVAFNRGETLPDVSAVARPLIFESRLVAAIAVAGPTPRIAGQLNEIAHALLGSVDEAAARLAQRSAS